MSGTYLAHHERESEYIIITTTILGHACNRDPQNQAASIRVFYIMLGHTYDRPYS